MKKTILLASFGLFLLTGCSKESTDTQVEQQSEELIYVLKTIDGKATWEEQSLDTDMLNSHTSTAKKSNNGNSTHTHGSLDLGSLQMTWSGTENNGGTHGSAVLTQQFGPFNVNVTMETDCVNVIGNEAVYTGRITGSENDPTGFLFKIGNKVSLKVIDNGQGNNAPADQFAGLSISIGGFLGGEPQVCESIGQPDFPSWNSPPTDIPAPGSVKINN